MSTNVQPISSQYADLFHWKSIATIASNEPAGYANKATDHFQVLDDSFFCLMAFLGSTNYDSFAGQFAATDVDSGNPHIYGAARVPSNFEVMITRDSEIKMMGSPVPQGVICSNGYLAGRQLIYPVLFPPLTTFDFEYFNVVPTILQETDGTTDIPLVINFTLQGYNVPVQNLRAFLLSWPEIQQKVIQEGRANWAQDFTAQTKNLEGLNR